MINILADYSIGYLEASCWIFIDTEGINILADYSIGYLEASCWIFIDTERINIFADYSIGYLESSCWIFIDTEGINILANYSICHCGGKAFIWMCVQFWTVTEKRLFASPDLTPLEFFYKINVETRDKFLARIFTINSAEQHSSFAHDLQSTLRLAVEFSILYREL